MAVLLRSYCKKLEDELFSRKMKKHYPLYADFEKKLAKAYQRKNPYQVCSAFYKNLGEEKIHVYGQTPIKTFFTLAKRLDLKPSDTWLDLGCGEGRGLFFLASCFGCRGIGVDHVEEFIQKAKSINKGSSIENRLSFICKDISSFFIPPASIVFLAGTCMEEDLLKKLCKSLQGLEKKTRIVTVSFPLCDYEDGFSVIEKYEGSFLWGKTDVYIQQLGVL